MRSDLDIKCHKDKPGGDGDIIPEDGSAVASDGGAGGGRGGVAVRRGVGAEHAARRQPGGTPQSGMFRKKPHLIAWTGENIYMPYSRFESVMKDTSDGGVS